MSKPLKLITWATAIITGIFLSGGLLNLARFPDGSDGETGNIFFWRLLASVLFGFSSQIGLFISPFVIRRNLWLRLLAIVLMIPFVYFFLLHDIVDLVRHLISIDRFFLEEWKINLQSHLASTMMILIWFGVYAYNIFLLIFKNPSSSIDNSAAA